MTEGQAEKKERTGKMTQGTLLPHLPGTPSPNSTKLRGGAQALGSPRFYQVVSGQQPEGQGQRRWLHTHRKVLGNQLFIPLA